MATEGPDLLNLSAWAGYGIAAFTAVGAWWFNRRKTDIDESALVLGKWKELVDTHEARLRDMDSTFSEYRRSTTLEINGLRERITTLEANAKTDAAIIREQQKEIEQERREKAGLQRQLSQISQSTAVQISRLREDPGIDDATAKLDRAGHNLRGTGSGVPGDE